jgi:hypothetical protein
MPIRGGLLTPSPIPIKGGVFTPGSPMPPRGGLLTPGETQPGGGGGGGPEIGGFCVHGMDFNPHLGEAVS